MKCPYAVHRKIVTKYEYEYDEDGKTTEAKEVSTSQAFLIDCVEDECGAWQNGKCNYKGGT